jgi:paraquat-inducible protein A
MTRDLQPAACPSCRLVQILPPRPTGFMWQCPRCGAHLDHANDYAWRTPLAAACAIAAAILYPVAITLPVMRLSQLGHSHETGILAGIWTLLTGGHAVLGFIVLLCSVAAPLAKIGAILTLTLGGRRFKARHIRLVHELVQLTGRWGMLDVLLVAVLVAAVKLGDLVDVAAGPGAIAFAAVVGLSMIASAAFDPRQWWAHA